MRLVGTRPYVNRFGDLLTLDLYEDECRTCGKPFQWTTTAARKSVVARCEACRADTPQSAAMRKLWDARRKAGYRLPRAKVRPEPGVQRAVVLEALAMAWEAGAPWSGKANAKRYAVPLVADLLGVRGRAATVLLAELEASGAIVHEALAERGERSRVRGYRVVGGSSVFD